MRELRELVDMNISTKNFVYGGFYRHCNSKYLQSAIDSNGFENFEGEYDIYEILYIKYMAVKNQKYLKACVLRDLEKKMTNEN